MQELLHQWRRVFLAATAFLLASCFREERIYILNPDGSGKVEFSVAVPLGEAIRSGSGQSPEQTAKHKLRNLLGASKGVSAFADVSWKIKSGNLLEIRGTAYFDDANKVRLKMPSGDLAPFLTRQGERIIVDCLPVPKEDGGIDFGDMENKKWKNAPKQNLDDLTPEERNEVLEGARQYLLQTRPRAESLSDMSSKVTLRLPAPAGKAVGFEAVSGNSYRTTRTGKMLLGRIDGLLADKKQLRAWVDSLASLKDDVFEEGEYETFFQIMGGVPKVLTLDFPAGAAPAFDYRKELAEARKAAPAMLERLGLDGASALPTLDRGEFKSVRFAGLRIVGSVPAREMRPFGEAPTGSAFAFVAELPGTVLDAKMGTIKTFVLDNGQNFGVEHREAVRLSADSRFVVFEIRSHFPPKPGATKIRRLEGEIVCTTARTTRTVDLGFERIATGQKGERYGAKITRYAGHHFRRNLKIIGLELGIEKQWLKEVRFLDENGVRLRSMLLHLDRHYKGTDLTFACDEALSDGGTIELVVFDGPQPRRIPFLLENVPLLPREAPRETKR
jgi:hypothetical protein